MTSYFPKGKLSGTEAVKGFRGRKKRTVILVKATKNVRERDSPSLPHTVLKTRRGSQLLPEKSQTLSVYFAED